MENRDSKIISNTKLWGITVCYAIIPFFLFYFAREDISISSFEDYIRDYATRLFLNITIIVITAIWILGIAFDFYIDICMIVVASIEMTIEALVASFIVIFPYSQFTIDDRIKIVVGSLTYIVIYILFFIYVIRTYIKKHK